MSAAYGETKPKYTTFPVIFEDEHVIAIDKPAFVLSHPNPGKTSTPAAFLGRYDFNERRFNCLGGPIWLVHRLDQDTSGVLLATKDKKTAESCRELFEARKVEKVYLTLVLGAPKNDRGIWKDHLDKRKTTSSVRSIVLPNRLPNAELHYRVINKFKITPSFLQKGSPLYRTSVEKLVSLLEVTLITGKTHQIRVQSSNREHPILGDEIYGNFSLNKCLKAGLGLDRLFLHAQSLKIRLPGQAKPLIFISELPQQLSCFLKILQK